MRNKIIRLRVVTERNTIIQLRLRLRECGGVDGGKVLGSLEERLGSAGFVS